MEAEPTIGHGIRLVGINADGSSPVQPDYIVENDAQLAEAIRLLKERDRGGIILLLPGAYNLPVDEK